MGPKGAQNDASYFGYLIRETDIVILRWSVDSYRTTRSEAQLTFTAKYVPKKHNIPFAMFVA
jgi:hypothetical protein